jgi:hypothetical protein
MHFMTDRLPTLLFNFKTQNPSLGFRKRGSRKLLLGASAHHWRDSSDGNSNDEDSKSTIRISKSETSSRNLNAKTSKGYISPIEGPLAPPQFSAITHPVNVQGTD